MIRSYLSHLECTACGDRFEADALHRTCPSCGKVLFARYDLDALRGEMPSPAFDGRSRDLWRYRELLPIRDDRFALSLGEGGTPMVAAPRAAERVGLSRGQLLIKDEGANPTGSFKARGL
ncbi:MAG TPA: pyridoxal-phosphate dependent enzyme, partial [Candidatus Limnocylindria bacterium]|nr:pyridoxal-phosphate dependent enzyme [Candidatus Limnocylindria bacterium]